MYFILKTTKKTRLSHCTMIHNDTIFHTSLYKWLDCYLCIVVFMWLSTKSLFPLNLAIKFVYQASSCLQKKKLWLQISLLSKKNSHIRIVHKAYKKRSACRKIIVLINRGNSRKSNWHIMQACDSKSRLSTLLIEYSLDIRKAIVYRI